MCSFAVADTAVANDQCSVAWLHGCPSNVRPNLLQAARWAITMCSWTIVTATSNVRSGIRFS